MTYPLPVSKLNSSVEFYDELIPLLKESKKYLKEHPWCKEIKNGWIFVNLGRVACIFLFEIDNIQSPEDNLIWVIVGDFPPMYLDTYNVDTTGEVVESYIYLGTEWVNFAQEEKSLEDCYPFDVGPDKDLIQLFRKKIELLEKTILPNIDSINYKEAFKISTPPTNPL